MRPTCISGLCSLTGLPPLPPLSPHLSPTLRTHTSGPPFLSRPSRALSLPGSHSESHQLAGPAPPSSLPTAPELAIPPQWQHPLLPWPCCPPSGPHSRVTLSGAPSAATPTEAPASTQTLVTSTPALGFGWGAVALFRGDSFLWRLNPPFFKLVPQTAFMEDGKALVIHSTPGVEVTVGESLQR